MEGLYMHYTKAATIKKRMSQGNSARTSMFILLGGYLSSVWTEIQLKRLSLLFREKRTLL